MKTITKQQLIHMGGLYFNNVMDGVTEYPYERKSGSEEEVLSWISALSDRYELYADFYAGRITKEALEAFSLALSKEEYAQLLTLLEKCKEEKEEEFVLFLPEKKELELLVKFSYRGLLFSTFYIMDPAVTIWSNYQGEFLVFAKDAALLKDSIE